MSIKPNNRALRFQQQIQVMVKERKNMRARYDDSYKHQWGSCNNELDQADEESEMDLWKDCNDPKGDMWLSGIMHQRRAIKTNWHAALRRTMNSERVIAYIWSLRGKQIAIEQLSSVKGEMKSEQKQNLRSVIG